MKHRPLSVTIMGFLFIVAGTAGILYHAPELKEIASRAEVIWVLLVRILAIVGGVFVLRGANWARWLLVTWISYHVIISYFHTTAELLAHAALTIVVVVALFYPKANAFFKKT